MSLPSIGKSMPPHHPAATDQYCLATLRDAGQAPCSTQDRVKAVDDILSACTPEAAEMWFGHVQHNEQHTDDSTAENLAWLKEYVSKLAVYRTRGLINGESLRRNSYSLLSESLQKALEDPNALYEDIQALGASHFPFESAEDSRASRRHYSAESYATLHNVMALRQAVHTTRKSHASLKASVQNIAREKTKKKAQDKLDRFSARLPMRQYGEEHCDVDKYTNPQSTVYAQERMVSQIVANGVWEANDLELMITQLSNVIHEMTLDAEVQRSLGAGGWRQIMTVKDLELARQAFVNTLSNFDGIRTLAGPVKPLPDSMASASSSADASAPADLTTIVKRYCSRMKPLVDPEETSLGLLIHTEIERLSPRKDTDRGPSQEEQDRQAAERRADLDRCDQFVLLAPDSCPPDSSIQLQSLPKELSSAAGMEVATGVEMLLPGLNVSHSSLRAEAADASTDPTRATESGLSFDSEEEIELLIESVKRELHLSALQSDLQTVSAICDRMRALPFVKAARKRATDRAALGTVDAQVDSDVP